MTLVASHLTTGASTASASTYTSESVAPAAQRLLVLALNGTRADARAPLSVTGLGLTWTWVRDGSFNTGSATYSQHLFIAWTGDTAPAPGGVSINWSASMTGCQWSLSEWDGVDNAAGPIVQSVYASDVTGATSPAATLAAFGSSTNGTHGALVVAANISTITAGTGFTLFGQAGNGGPNATIASEGRADADTTVDFGGTSLTAWSVIAAEIREAAGSAPTNHIVGDSGVGADTVSAATALTVADAGVAADTVVAETIIAVTDVAASTDVASVIVASTVTDAGSGADIASTVTALTVNDVGVATDDVVAETIIAVTDAATGVDTANVEAASTVTEVGSGADGVEVSVASVVSDMGAGTDTVVTAAAGTSLDDAVIGTDVVAVTASSTVIDAGSGTDTVVSSAPAVIDDAATGTDEVSAATAIVVLDAGVGVDTETVVASVTVPDLVTGADAVTLAAALIVSDVGVGSDAVFAPLVAASLIVDMGAGEDVVIVIAQRAAVVSMEGGPGRGTSAGGRSGTVGLVEAARARQPIIEG